MGLQAEPTGVELPVRSGNLTCMTEYDLSLSFAKATAQDHPISVDDKNPKFSLDSRVMYQWVEGKYQVVVPAALHPRVMLLVHDPPLASHLGPEKALKRILQQF